MGDLLSTGAAWLEKQRKAHMSQSVTYSRGAASVSVSATLGRTTYQIDRGDGISVEERTRDYLIAVADLVLSSVAVEPQPGDRIVEAGAPTKTYEVMAPEGTETSWRFCDEHRQTYRIHAKLIAES